MVIRVNFVKAELMVEICSMGLVRAIAKSTTHEIDLEHPLKPIKVMKKWPLFVNKQLFWWSSLITLDNNNAVLTYS